MLPFFRFHLPNIDTSGFQSSWCFEYPIFSKNTNYIRWRSLLIVNWSRGCRVSDCPLQKKLFKSRLCKKKNNYDTHSSSKNFYSKTLQLPRSQSTIYQAWKVSWRWFLWIDVRSWSPGFLGVDVDGDDYFLCLKKKMKNEKKNKGTRG